MANLGSVLISIEDYTRACQVLAERVDRSRRVLGPNHPDTLEAMLKLARALVGAGDRTSGRALSEQALAATIATLGPDSPATLAARGQHGRVLLRVGDAAAGGQRPTRPVPPPQAQDRPGGDSTLDALAGLADSLGRCGEHLRARKLDQQLFELRSRCWGADHVATQWALGDLAWNLEQLGELPKFGGPLPGARRGSTQTLGPDAPDTVWALEGLARVLARAESHAAHSRPSACSTRRRHGAVDRRATRHWRSSRTTPGSSARSVSSREARAKLAGNWPTLTSETTASRTSAPWSACSGSPRRTRSSGRATPPGPSSSGSPDRVGRSTPRAASPPVPTILERCGLGHNLGLTMGAPGAARRPPGPPTRRFFDGYMRIHGAHHRKVADMHSHMGDVLLEQGDAEEARTRYAEALAVLRKHPGPDDPDTLEVISHDADALFAMGRKVAGRNQARSVAETLPRTLGPNNGLTRRAEAQVERMTRAAARRPARTR